MNKQEIFTTVANHLLTQRKKSFSVKHGNCRYRGDDNTKCAVGCLIPDEQYEVFLEGLGLSSALANPYHWYGEAPRLRKMSKILQSQGIDTKDPSIGEFLGNLQWIHDSKDVQDWYPQLFQFATEEGLTL